MNNEREEQLDANIAFFVPVGVAFPGVTADKETLRALLSHVDRGDAIFTAARLNLVISDRSNDEAGKVHWSIRHQQLQSALVLSFFSPEQVDKIDAFIKEQRASPGNWQVFFRGQLLELISWACALCPDQFDLPRIATDLQARERFAQAVLIVSDLWAERVYKGRFSGAGDLEDKRMGLLGPFRQSHAETALGPDLPRAFIRGKRLICKGLIAESPDFPEVFRSKTGLSLEEYYRCLLWVLVQSLAFTSAPGTSRIQVQREFDPQRFCNEVPQLRDEFSRFIASESQTADAIRASFGGGGLDVGDYAPRDLSTLRRRPIFLDHNNRAIVIDPAYLAEKACAGPLFHVRENRMFDAFGMAVERYVQEILRNMYPSLEKGLLYDRLRCPLMGRGARGSEVELADAYLGGDQECVFFEIKGKWLREDVLAGAPEDYQRHVREKYGGETGVGQLARNISKLASGGWKPNGNELVGVRRIFPLLVAYDERLDAPLHPRFLAQEFSKSLCGQDTLGEIQLGEFAVSPLTVMTINDLEILECSVREFSLCNLLRDYSRERSERFVSLHNFMASSKSYSGKFIENERVRSQFSEELRKLEELFS